MVNIYIKKLLSHVEGIEEYVSTHKVIKNIRSHLLTFDLSELNDELVEQLSNSEWFADINEQFLQ